jgi:molybdopterin converting factor small subunit
MATLLIDIPPDAERRLREEAGRRNATVESYAASLIVNQLEQRLPAEFEIGDEEIAVIQDAVREVRSQVER